MLEKMYTPQEVADFLQMNVNIVRKYLREGKMSYYRPSRKYLISESQLQEYLNKNKNEQ